MYIITTKSRLIASGKLQFLFWVRHLHLKPKPDSVLVWGKLDFPKRSVSPVRVLTKVKDTPEYPGYRPNVTSITRHPQFP